MENHTWKESRSKRFQSGFVFTGAHWTNWKLHNLSLKQVPLCQSVSKHSMCSRWAVKESHWKTTQLWWHWTSTLFYWFPPRLFGLWPIAFCRSVVYDQVDQSKSFSFFPFYMNKVRTWSEFYRDTINYLFTEIWNLFEEKYLKMDINLCSIISFCFHILSWLTWGCN